MGFITALIVWLVMAATIATGVVLAVRGQPWLMFLSVGIFLVLMVKFGCLSQESH
jgi:hypothetical protein